MNRKEQLMSYLKSDSSNSFLLFAIAKECESENNLDDALAWYQNLVESDPGYTGVYYHFGRLLEKMNSNQAAKEVYQKGIEVCQQKNDLHAASELRNAMMNLLMED